MLGCQDFCGHYDWTFHYVRRRWGQSVLALLWDEAIGRDSQQHYANAGLASGLRGLYETWTKTGEEEHCNWTFTVNEARNVLRCDMRECPSKGFLIRNDLHADEDYCDHCMGWTIPMLESVGGEILEHEHNHCGQCWITIRMKGRISFPLKVDADIRNDPRWKCGFLDRWAHNRRVALTPSMSPSSDSCEVLEAWFHAASFAADRDDTSHTELVVTDEVYNDRQRCPVEPRGVLIGLPPADLAATAARYLAVLDVNRPLLLHAYLPTATPVDFVSLGLPRPLPILPLLIRKQVYTHSPGGPHSSTAAMLGLLIEALGKNIDAPPPA